MKKIIQRTALTLVVLFALAQLANPARTNPPVVCDFIQTNSPPPQVAALLRASCYDCHSNETKWPWYSHVAPVSWLVVSDVNDGRRKLNFSDWPQQYPDRAARRLDAINEMLDDKEMPPAKYTLIHKDARLSDADRKMLADWADAQSGKVKSAAPAK